jgi:hypothetical protein
MRIRDLINGVDYGELMQRQMFCFGSSDDGGGGGGGLSDEDIDQNVQQDIAAAAAGLSADDYSYGGGFDPSESNIAAAIQATQDILSDVADARSLGLTGEDLNRAAIQAQATQAANRDVVQAVKNIASIFGGQREQRAGEALAAQQREKMQGLLTTPPVDLDAGGYDPVTGLPIGLETTIGPDGQVITTNLAGLTDAQRSSMPLSMKIAGMMGSQPYGYELDLSTGRPIGQMGTPGFGLLGQGINALTNVILGPPKTVEDLIARGAYTGMTGVGDSGGSSDSDEIKPVDPVTGQCEEGYIFDEDLQACRLDTRADAGAGGGVGSVVPPAPGAYARMGLLDVAPTGLPQFQQRYGVGFGTPQDFTAANLNFRRQGATYPEYFKRPPQLSGYTLLS